MVFEVFIDAFSNVFINHLSLLEVVGLTYHLKEISPFLPPQKS